MVHTAESKEELDNDTESLLTIARKTFMSVRCTKISTIRWTKYSNAIWSEKIDTLRTLTTESLAVFMPFRVQEIRHENGIYYGQNVIIKNMIVADRKQLIEWK